MQAVAELADEAKTHLLAARSMRDELGGAARRALLPAVACELVLQRLHACGYAPFSPELGKPLGTRLPLALARHWLLGTY